ncbi:hypothetical protein E2C01_101103 [Portunus trituberculatus]|uniref:Uncharacterized protein n=1 Tax=Portunus trituberculatus TaxID=210409 RepID=A0A5B7KF05_PORTR|nr:hypothetical protein [Portunus trituberculatus]
MTGGGDTLASHPASLSGEGGRGGGLQAWVIKEELTTKDRVGRREDRKEETGKEDGGRKGRKDVKERGARRKEGGKELE